MRPFATSCPPASRTALAGDHTDPFASPPVTIEIPTELGVVVEHRQIRP
jgi:hypothetical protein